MASPVTNYVPDMGLQDFPWIEGQPRIPRPPNNTLFFDYYVTDRSLGLSHVEYRHPFIDVALLPEFNKNPDSVFHYAGIGGCATIQKVHQGKITGGVVSTRNLVQLEIKSPERN